MNQEQVAEIVARVVYLVRTRLLADAPRRRVLMLFSGAGTGYVAGMEAIRLLTGANHDLTLFMTASAKHVIGVENARQAGAEEIIGPEMWVDTPKLVREADLVLVPTLSMNSAGRLALGLMDSLFSTLVLGALLADTPVIAICDGADPYGNGGLVFSDTHDTAPALRARMVENLGRLIEYGIDLVPEHQFLASMMRRMQPESRPAALPVERVRVGGTGRSPILTAADLSHARPGAAVHIPGAARLTPLARDHVRQKNLKLVYEQSR